ncbi:MAG: ABC transporter substrate-binding protein [Clostridiaceae bacterium]|nr:ABC transporter substrate-binding protein [Eubacteriales bacterium]
MKRALVALLVFSLLLGFCFSASAADNLVPQIKIGISGSQGPLIPFNDVGTTNWEVQGLVYDSLYQMGTDRQPIPCLATSYDVSDDYKTYTFHLRDDVKWHDGTPFTAEDVRFTYDMVANVIHSVVFTTPAKEIATMNIPDPYTIEFVLSAPRSEAIVTDLFGYMPIVPKHVYEGLSEAEVKTNTNNIGTGPYYVADFEEGNYYTLKANTDYFGGAPVAEELVLIVMTEPTAAFTAIQSKQIDALMRPLSAELIEQYKADSTLGVLQGPGFRSRLMLLNEYRYPFSEQDFRTAIASALDIEDIANTVTLGFSTVGSPGFVHPEYYLYNPATPKYTQDTAKAKALLDGLGFVDGNGDGVREDKDGKKLSFELLVYANNPASIRIAEIVKEQLAPVGIEVTVKALESSVVDELVAPNWDAVKPGDYDMAIWGWGDVFMSTPSRFVEQFHSDPAVAPSNLTRVRDAELDEIMEGVRDSVDIKVRNEWVNKMQIKLAERNTLIVFYYEDQAYAYNPAVYDHWQLTLGRSMVNKISLTTPRQSANEAPAASAAPTASTAPVSTPAAATPNTQQPESGGRSPILWIALGVVAVIVVVVLLTRKKKN